MKNGRLQCKDFANGPIVAFLRKKPGKWHNRTEIAQAFPSYTSDKLILAKMRNLICRGLVQGCACGCRGDFYVDK